MQQESIVNETEWQVPKYETVEFREKKSDYCICIPVLNEGENIKKQLEDMLPYSYTVDIILADWGSTDGSMNQDFLRQKNVRALLTLREPGRQGTQLRMAFSYALKQGYKGILQIDGNHKDGVDAIPGFVTALQEGYDYVQGSRYVKGGRAVHTPLYRDLAIRFLASPLLSLGARYWYTDVTNGFRAYSRRYLLHPLVQPFRNVFVKYEFSMYLTVRAHQIGLRTKEIPVSRVYPKGKVRTKISFFRGNVGFFTSIAKAAFGYYNPRHENAKRREG